MVKNIIDLLQELEVKTKSLEKTIFSLTYSKAPIVYEEALEKCDYIKFQANNIKIEIKKLKNEGRIVV